jgi:hypothetical protein
MDLDVRGSSSSSMNIYGCDNWIVQDCDIGKDAGKFGLSGAGNPTHTSCDNIIIRRCNFDSGDRIIHSYAAVGVEDGINIRAGCHNWDIYNNVFLDWSHSAFYIVNLSATYTSSGNKFHRNEISAPDIDYGRPLGVDGLEDKAMDNEVYNNYIHDCGVRIQLNANGTKFHNNIINGMSNAATPYRVDGSAQGIALEGYSNCFPHDMEIYNNVIANCDEAGLLITCDGLDIQHNLIKNNIFFNCGKDSKNSYDGYQIVITDNAGNLDNTFQNNLLFKSGVTDLIYYGHNTSNDYPHTIEEFNAENGTASDVISGNIAGNPLFIAGSPYNYRLGVGSPAINTGLNVGLTTDYDGNTMKDPPSIGAYEHYLSVLPVNHPPVVTISNPRKGNKYENSATITIDAVASDPDGTISKVEFYCGSIKLSELTLAPYTYTWKDVSAGTYAITAVATDNLNASTTSSPVELVVESNIKYDANSEIIKLYPNPSDGHFSIKFVNPLQNEKNAIVITDLAGKQIYNDFVLKEETIKQIDISYIKSGIYILMIIYKEIFVTKKIIID